MTVGLAAYNGEQHIVQSIESLLGQTYDDFLLIISDNASTDRTGEICQEYALEDPRIRYHRNESNLGMAGNYNLLFGMCRSKYFRWATTDDYSSPDMLADAVEVLDADPRLALCYPRAYFVDDEGREIGKWQDELHLLEDDPVERFWLVIRKIDRVHHHLGLMRADILGRTGLMGKHVSSDKGMIAEMSLHGRFFQIPQHQFYRRMHEESSSWATFDEGHQARLYHAAGVNRIPFNTWRYYWRFVQGIGRSPLGARDRARAYYRVLKIARWHRKELVDEALRETRRWVGARGGRRGSQTNRASVSES